MKKIGMIIIHVVLASVIVGQVVKIPLALSSNATMTILDLIVGILSLFFVIKLILKKELLEFFFYLWANEIWRFALLFILIAIFSLVVHLNAYSLHELINAFSYLLRLASIFFVTSYLSLHPICSPMHLLRRFTFWGFVGISLGYLQLIFIPDFSFMTIFGWDPHLGRMLSTFFDPNYFGVFIVLVMLLSLSLLYNKPQKIYKYVLITLFIIGWIALYLTYSRSAWVTGGIAIPLAIFTRSWKVSLLVLCVFCMAIIVPNRLSGRFVQGGSIFNREVRESSLSVGIDSESFNGDPSAAARGISLRRGWELTKNNWLLGVGYNAYGPALVKSGIVNNGYLNGYSSQGSDSSLLNIFATTGIGGLLFFVLFLYSIAKKYILLWRLKDPKGVFLGFVVAWVLSSFLNNTLLYPFLLFSFLLISAHLLSADPDTRRAIVIKKLN
jgi:putative inorganic carbon (HCO3(-)) transporter